jgi:ParB/RepB/Spo0J family partition protein
MPAKKRLVTIPFESIVADVNFNCRKEYMKIDELKQSILEDGLLQPVGVSLRNNPENGETQCYFLVYGFRRYYAIAKIREELGGDAYTTLDVVLNDGNLEDLRVRNLKENIERDSLSAFEISQQVKRLVLAGFEQRDIAARLGRNQSWVSYHYKVATNLTHQAQQALKSGDITLEQALHIADVDEDKQNQLVEQVLSADTRADARKILKEAASDVAKRRKYVNKGRPTARNLVQYVSDVSFEAESSLNSKEEKTFYNGVAAGIRIALGDAAVPDVKDLSAKEQYSDVNYHSKNNKIDTTKSTAVTPTATVATVVDEKPKKKRGRPRKDAGVALTL